MNDDVCCFAWSVVSALYPATVSCNRISSYPHFSTCLNLDCIDFPMKLENIKKFETNNNISINVYGLEHVKTNEKLNTEVVGPLYYSKNRQSTHVNLLLISDDNGNSHYCWIKDMSRLLGSQLNSNTSKKYFCDGCFQFFYSKNKLDNHQENDCNHVYTKIPTNDLKINKYGEIIPENILQFENFEKQLKLPFVIYADFECILKPIKYEEPTSVEEAFTIDTSEHRPYAFVYFIKCSYDTKLSKLEYYFGEDASKVFCERLELDIFRLYNDHLKYIVPMNRLTQQEKDAFENATVCNICDKIIENYEEKVHDHDHLTGRVRLGAAHSICNLNFKIPKYIPVFFHNLSGYDSHLFIKELCCFEDEVDVIAQTKEKYISFSKNILVDSIYNYEKKKEGKVFFKIRFLDSFRFVSESLESLSNNLDSDQCIEIKKKFKDKLKFDIIRKKGVFPYSYIDDIDKLKEKNLPSKVDFFDKLSNEEISDTDYERAKNVWDIFECKTLEDYATIYLISDCLILTDFFESFRTLCLDKYKLDPAQYFTAPSLSWDAMMRSTRVKLELLVDIDMIHFLKKNIRGGICHCSVRKSTANNPFFSDYDDSKPTSYIMYLDSTNLYGYSMSQCLPTSNFSWLTEKEIKEFNIMTISDDNEYGYILEVDITYPQYLHDLHNELPFLAENIVPPESKSKKLICNLNDKFKYVIHYRNLKQAMENGLKVNHIHRVLKFKQSAWLKPYIDLNTEMRNKAKSKLEKNSFKLLNNVIYGKSLENIDKRVDVRLLTHWENSGRKIGAQCLIAKPNYKNCSIFHENFVAIQMCRMNVTYNKPVQLGFCILELSKIVLYKFYYNYLKNKYQDKISMLYTDTDSLVVHVETDNFYQDIRENLNKFDTSNYELNNIHNITPNKSIIGNMKDEYGGKLIKSFYGTGAKAYCIILGEKLDFYINYLKPRFHNNIHIMESTNDHLTVNVNTEVFSGTNTKFMVEELLKNFNTNVNIEIIKHLNGALIFRITDALTKKAKGVKKCVIRKDIKLDDYQDVVEQEKILYRRMNIFKSNLHNMYTQMKNKVALSAKDDKRYILSGSSKTLAWGHYIIYNSNNLDNLLNLTDYFYADQSEDLSLCTLLTQEIKYHNIPDSLLDSTYKSLLSTL